jgi:lipopolysaccharide/colanic/teichoic acid biosynthesis glycosyltransferase
LKRLFDILFTFIGILILTPVFILIYLVVLITSGFPVFYLQTRVGKNNRDFKMIKFRSMQINADKKGLLTVGGRDPRITKVGYFLRQHKLDELPQLFNVLFGTMSLVGPRPEVRHYVDMYNEEQKKVLKVKPGVTDLASIEYIKESELLSKSQNPEETYINEIMPAKLELNLKYIKKIGLGTDLKLIFRTIGKVIKG